MDIATSFLPERAPRPVTLYIGNDALERDAALLLDMLLAARQNRIS